MNHKDDLFIERKKMSADMSNTITIRMECCYQQNLILAANPGPNNRENGDDHCGNG